MLYTELLSGNSRENAVALSGAVSLELNLKGVQWNLRIKDTLGSWLLSFIQRLSSGGRFYIFCYLQPHKALRYLPNVFLYN